MIDYLSAVSVKLRWLKPLSFVLAIGAFSLFGYVVLSEPSASKDVYLIPSVVALLWALVAMSMLSLFPYVPAKPSKDIGFFKKIKVRITRFFYQIASLIFIALSSATIWFSVRLLHIWLS